MATHRQYDRISEIEENFYSEYPEPRSDDERGRVDNDGVYTCLSATRVVNLYESAWTRVELLDNMYRKIDFQSVNFIQSVSTKTIHIHHRLHDEMGAVFQRDETREATVIGFDELRKLASIFDCNIKEIHESAFQIPAELSKQLYNARTDTMLFQLTGEPFDVLITQTRKVPLTDMVTE